MAFAPVLTLEELDALSDADILDGYARRPRAGRESRACVLVRLVQSPARLWNHSN